MAPGQMQQSLENAHAHRAAIPLHRLRPRAAVRPDQFAAFQKIMGSAFDRVAFVRMHMGLVGGEATGLDQRVHGDLAHEHRMNVEQS